MNRLQDEIIRLEKELQDLKTVQKFGGNVQTYLYEAFNTTTKIKIYYDNPTQPPITTLQPTTIDRYTVLGRYNESEKSHLAFFEQNHTEVLINSTQPILRVENVA